MSFGFSMSSPRSAYPRPWLRPFIERHLYLPSGELVSEQIIYVGMAVDEFCMHLCSVRGFLFINLPLSSQRTGSVVRSRTKHNSCHVAT